MHIVSLDVRHAFDCIKHGLLMQAMLKRGILLTTSTACTSEMTAHVEGLPSTTTLLLCMPSEEIDVRPSCPLFPKSSTLGELSLRLSLQICGRRVFCFQRRRGSCFAIRDLSDELTLMAQCHGHQTTGCSLRHTNNE